MIWCVCRDRRTPVPLLHDRSCRVHASTGQTDGGSLPQALVDVSGVHPQGSAQALLPSVSPGGWYDPSAVWFDPSAVWFAGSVGWASPSAAASVWVTWPSVQTPPPLVWSPPPPAESSPGPDWSQLLLSLVELLNNYMVLSKCYITVTFYLAYFIQIIDSIKLMLPRNNIYVSFYNQRASRILIYMCIVIYKQI